MTSFLKIFVFLGGGTIFFSLIFFRKSPPLLQCLAIVWCSWTAAFTWAHCCSSGMPLNMVTTPPRRSLTDFPRMTAGGWLGGFSATQAPSGKICTSRQIGWKSSPKLGMKIKIYTVLEEYIRHSPEKKLLTLTFYWPTFWYRQAIYFDLKVYEL